MDQKFYSKYRASKIKLSAMLLLPLNMVFSSFAWADVSSYSDCKDGNYCATLNSINPYGMYSFSNLSKETPPYPSPPSYVKDKWGETYTQYGKGIQTDINKWQRKPYGKLDYLNYTDPEHKNVSININNLDSKETMLGMVSTTRFKVQWWGLEFKAHGKDADNKIIIGNPSLKANIYEQYDGNSEHYRNLSIDFKNVHYTGNITLIGTKTTEDSTDTIVRFLDNALANDFKYKSGVSKSIQEAYLHSPGFGGYVHMDNVILDGNLKMTDVSLIVPPSGSDFKSFTITHSTINGNIDWSSNAALRLQLHQDTFNNSHLTFLRDSLPAFPISEGQNITVDSSKFFDSTIRYDYAPTANIDKVHGNFSTYTYTNNTLQNSDLEINDSSVFLWLEHTRFDGGNIKITSDAKMLPSQIDFTGSRVNLRDFNITGGATSLGAVFNFKKMTYASTSGDSFTYTYDRDISQTLSTPETSKLTMVLKSSDLGHTAPPPRNPN